MIFPVAAVPPELCPPKRLQLSKWVGSKLPSFPHIDNPQSVSFYINLSDFGAPVLTVLKARM